VSKSTLFHGNTPLVLMGSKTNLIMYPGFITPEELPQWWRLVWSQFN